MVKPAVKYMTLANDKTGRKLRRLWRRKHIINVERGDQSRLEAINKQAKGKGIPEELFFVDLEMQKALVHFQSTEQKREAVRLLDIGNADQLFDELIQRASQCVSPGSGDRSNFAKSGYVKQEIGTSSGSSGTVSRGFGGAGGGVNGASTSSYLEKEGLKKSEMFTRDDSYVMKSKAGLHLDGFSTTSVVAPQIQDSSLKTYGDAISSSLIGQDGDKVSLIKT